MIPVIRLDVNLATQKLVETVTNDPKEKIKKNFFFLYFDIFVIRCGTRMPKLPGNHIYSQIFTFLRHL